MSFLDKILEGDMDEKAVNDMQQSLQSDLFTSTEQSYIPPPPSISSYETTSTTGVATVGARAQHVAPQQRPPVVPIQLTSSPMVTSQISQGRPPVMATVPSTHVTPLVNTATLTPLAPASTIKTEQPPPQQQQPQPSYHVMPTTVIKTEPGQMLTMLHPIQMTSQRAPGPGQVTVQHTPVYTSALSSTASIVPTAVITPQRVTAPIGPTQVIAVSSPMMVTGAQFSNAHPPQTIMVSASPTSTQVGTMRPVMPGQTATIRPTQSKPMVVPLQPLVQVKPGPIPIQPARPPPKAEQKTAAILSSMSTRESVQKLKAFLTNLLNISNKQDQATGQTVKDLIGKVMTNNIDEETFLNELQVALNSPPQPHLLVFLKQSVPVLRSEMQNRQRSMSQMVKPAPSTGVSSPFPGLAPVQTNKIMTTNISTGHGHPSAMTASHQFGNTGTQYHPAPTFSAPQRTFADKYKKKYTLSKDDPEINDVTSMAGVNLREEAANITNTVAETVSQETRSTQDVTLVTTESIASKVNRICEKYKVSSAAADVQALLSHALEARMKNLVEKLVSVNHHRLNLRVGQHADQVTTNCNVREQLKMLQQVQVEEGKRRQEKEKAIIMKEAKSRSKLSNSEAKAKAKQVALEEEQLIRQREANETALAAIGSRKRPKNVEFGGGGEGGAGGGPARLRSRRINMKDLIFLCEGDPFLRKSPLLYKLHVSAVK